MLASCHKRQRWITSRTGNFTIWIWFATTKVLIYILKAAFHLTAMAVGGWTLSTSDVLWMLPTKVFFILQNTAAASSRFPPSITHQFTAGHLQQMERDDTLQHEADMNHWCHTMSVTQETALDFLQMCVHTGILCKTLLNYIWWNSEKYTADWWNVRGGCFTSNLKNIPAQLQVRKNGLKKFCRNNRNNIKEKGGNLKLNLKKQLARNES